MAEQGKFVTGSLMRHVVVMSWSGTLGLGFTFLIGFLALWWVSQLEQEHLIAALGFAGTIQFAVISVAIGMMIGAVALVARSLGQGEKEPARRHSGGALRLRAWHLVRGRGRGLGAGPRQRDRRHAGRCLRLALHLRAQPSGSAGCRCPGYCRHKGVMSKATMRPPRISKLTLLVQPSAVLAVPSRLVPEPLLEMLEKDTSV